MRDSDAPQSKTAGPRCFPHLALTFVIVAAAVLVFESAKDFIFPQITRWGSHLITIGFSSIAVTIAAALIFRRYYQLLRDSHEEVAERRRVEEALVTERNRLRAVIDAVPDQIYFKDSQGRFLLVNDSLARALGATKPEEVLGKTDRDFFPADLASQYAADEQRVLQSGEPLINKEEPALDLPTAVSTWHLTTKVPLRNQEGVMVGTVGVSRDISARKQDEEALRIHTRQLEAVRVVIQEITRELDLVALLDLILQRTVDLVGASGGTIVFLDEAGRVLVPQVHSALFDPLDWQSIPVGLGVVGRVAATRTGLIVNDYHSWAGAISTSLTRTGVTASMAEPLLYRDELVGVINLVHTEDRATFTDRDGNILRLLAAQAAIAIENARLYEAMVRRSSEREALLQASRAIESSLDLERVLQAIVHQAAAISAAPVVRLFLLDEDAQLLRCRVAVGFPLDAEPDLVLPVGKSFSGEVAATEKPLAVADTREDSRTYFPAHIAKYGVVSYLGLPVKFQTHMYGVLVFNTPAPRHYTTDEITFLAAFAQQAAVAIQNARLFAAVQQAMEDIQRTQAELIRSEKLRALGQMGAGIAHDLNNVLAVILGQVELLKLGAADPEVRKRLLTLETAAADGADVVRRLQDFARPRGASPLISLEMPRIVLETLEITQPRWKDEPERRGVHIEVRTALTDLPPILGHAPEMREALTNLIFNAVDAMPQGGILNLAGSATSDEVSLAITDTGVGMTEEVCARVFEPFFTTKGLQGSGLGLAVVYGIMERHGGRIAVTSALGQGTTVTLTFQIAREAEAASGPPGLVPVTPRRLLIIDDDPMVRQTVVSLLRAAGHSVVEADGGAAGLVRLAETPMDCVLTDLGMPEMTGWDVARAVRTLHPNLPIVLLTGWGEQAAGEADHHGLVDRVLGKPVRLEELLRVIREITERSAA